MGSLSFFLLFFLIDILDESSSTSDTIINLRVIIYYILRVYGFLK